MQDILRIATRQSKLALWQANFVADRLREAHAGLAVELVGITTKGDRWLQAPLSEVGGKGLFVKELEAAMLDGRADIAVHSAKDLPAAMPEAFALPVLAYREDVRDVLVSVAGDLDALPAGARVGSSSLRRKAQLLARRGDLLVEPVRGNVDTRLGKLAAGEFDAIVLAQAGLNRLELTDALPAGQAYALDPALCLPAPGQGALAIQCLADGDAVTLLGPLADEAVARCVSAERGVSEGLGGDCSLPLAAHAEIGDDGHVHLAARLCSADGATILHASGSGADPGALARQVVASLLADGGEAVLAALR